MLFEINRDCFQDRAHPEVVPSLGHVKRLRHDGARASDVEAEGSTAVGRTDSRLVGAPVGLRLQGATRVPCQQASLNNRVAEKSRAGCMEEQAARHDQPTANVRRAGKQLVGQVPHRIRVQAFDSLDVPRGGVRCHAPAGPLVQMRCRRTHNVPAVPGRARGRTDGCGDSNSGGGSGGGGDGGSDRGRGGGGLGSGACDTSRGEVGRPSSRSHSLRYHLTVH